MFIRSAKHLSGGDAGINVLPNTNKNKNTTILLMDPLIHLIYTDFLIDEYFCYFFCNLILIYKKHFKKLRKVRFGSTRIFGKKIVSPKAISRSYFGRPQDSLWLAGWYFLLLR